MNVNLALSDLADLGYGAELWRNDVGSWAIALWNAGAPYRRNPSWMRNDGNSLAGVLVAALEWARANPRVSRRSLAEPGMPVESPYLRVRDVYAEVEGRELTDAAWQPVVDALHTLLGLLRALDNADPVQRAHSDF